MNMIKKAAKASYEASYRNFPMAPPWEELEEARRRFEVARVRAVIEAIREADHNMTAPLVEPVESRAEVVRIWETMIDVILGEDVRNAPPKEGK